MPRIDLVQLRRGPAADWTTADPVLAAGEVGWESDTRKLKIGDGSTAWTLLPYVGVAPVTSVNGETGAVSLDAADVGADAAGAASSAVSAHVGASDPHGDRAAAAALVDDLSGVTDASTARTNLGLGTLATLSAVTSAQITDGTIVADDVADANKDGSPSTPSLRTLGTGSQQAAAGDHAHPAAYAPIGSAIVTIGADGTLTAERALAAGSGLALEDGGAGGSATIHTLSAIAMLPTGAIAQTLPRVGPSWAYSSITSGTLTVAAVWLAKDQTVANLSFTSGTTAAGTPTNWWFLLADASLAVRAVSADQSSAGWAANTTKTLAMGTPYVVPSTGLYYCGVMVKATATPTIYGAAGTGTGITGLSPILAATANTGMSTPPSTGTTLAALTARAQMLYASVS